jgi:hypothetical protein
VVLRREADRVCLPLAHLHALDDLALRWAAALDGTWCEHVCDAWERWRSARVAEVRAWESRVKVIGLKWPLANKDPDWITLEMELRVARPGRDVGAGGLRIALGVAGPHGKLTGDTGFLAGWFGRLDILTTWMVSADEKGVPSTLVAMGGRLDVVQAMCARWRCKYGFRHHYLASAAAREGHTHILDWLRTVGWSPLESSGVDQDLGVMAGLSGRLSMVAWLVPFGLIRPPRVFLGAAMGGCVGLLGWLMDCNPSVVPRDWSQWGTGADPLTWGADPLTWAAHCDALATFEFLAARIPGFLPALPTFGAECARRAAFHDNVRVLAWLRDHGVPMAGVVHDIQGLRCARLLHETGDLARFWNLDVWVRLFRSRGRYTLVPFLRDEARLPWDAVHFTRAVLSNRRDFDHEKRQMLAMARLAGFPVDTSPEAVLMARTSFPETAEWLASQSNLT